jgi:hypothetical protein
MHHPAWLLLFAVIGIVLSFLLYQKKAPWSKTLNYLFAFLRWAAVMLVGILIIDFKLILSTNQEVAPTIVLSIDNSSSIIKGGNYDENELNTAIRSMKSKLEADGFSVTLQAFDEVANDSIRFNAYASNIDALIKKSGLVSTHRNPVAQVLLTDGIYNSGLSPLYYPYKLPLYTIGMGDTTLRKDIGISNVLYNKVSYTGNRFPIQVELSNTGFEPLKLPVQLYVRGKLTQEQLVDFTELRQTKSLTFYHSAQEEGLLPIEIRIQTPNTDFIKENNTRAIFPEIIADKQRIALLSPYPHPDIKALRSAIESAGNYELEVFIENITPFKKDKYDLAILFHLPNSRRTFNQAHNELSNENTPSLFVYGGDMNVTAFNLANGLVNIGLKRGSKDLVTPVLNPSFSAFQLSDYSQRIINRMTPVHVPFASYTIDPNAEILAFQQIAKTDTDRPMIVLSKNSRPKKGVFFAENFWQWRLQEFATEEQHEGIHEVLLKTVQYLAAKEDKRRFKAYTAENEYQMRQPVLLITELYDELYEKVYGNQIALELRRNGDVIKNYTFTSAANQRAFDLGTMEAGNYQFTASTTYQGNDYRVNGEFAVTSFSLEDLDLEARHDLLAALAQKNKGKHLHWDNRDQLNELLDRKLFKTKLKTEQRKINLSDYYWPYVLIILLLGAEWFFRKFLGSY